MSSTNYPEGYKPYKYRVRPTLVTPKIFWFKFKEEERYVAENYWDDQAYFAHWSRIGTYHHPFLAREACKAFANKHLAKFKEEMSEKAKIQDCNNRIENLGKLP